MKTVATLWFILAAGVPLFARPVAYWPYDKLTREADLIVIATPVSVRDTRNKTTIPGITRDNQPVAAIAMEARFEVLATLKGREPLKTLELRYLREARPPTVSVNGPGLVSFDPKEKKRYLLFLRREKGGGYTALTGQTDPDGSVKDLGTYP